MAVVYPTICQQKTSGCAPAVCAISSLAADLDCSTVASLSASDVTACSAVITNLFLGSGSLGPVDGDGNVAAQSLVVQGDAAVDTITATAASFGSAGQPTQTNLQGVGLQAGLILLSAFTTYSIPTTTPHLSLILALYPVLTTGNSTIYLPDAPTYAAPFPPLGYRLSIFNIDPINSMNVTSPFHNVYNLTGGAGIIQTTVSLAANTGFAFVWTGSLWLFSFT